MVVIGIIVGGLAGITSTEDLFGVLNLGISAAIVVTIAARNRSIRVPLILGFAIRAFLALLQAYLFELPGSGADTVKFERVGWEYAQDGLVAVLQQFSIGSEMYRWFIGIVYSVTGRSVLSVLSFNVLFGTLIIWNAYKASSLIWGGRAGVRAAWVVAMFPTLVLNSAIMLREVAVTYFFTLGTYMFMKWMHTYRTRPLVMSLIGISIGAMFHRGVFVAVPVVGAIAFWRSVRTLLSEGSKARATAVLGPMLLLIIGVVMANANWVSIITEEYIEKADMVALSETQVIAARSRAAYPSSLTIHTPLDILTKTPIRIIYFLFAPFPWMARSVLDIMGLIDSSLYLIILSLIWYRRKSLRDRLDTRALLGLFIGVLVIFSLTVGNYGTAVRHRAKLVFIPIVIVSGIQVPRLKTRSPRPLVT